MAKEKKTPPTSSPVEENKSDPDESANKSSNIQQDFLMTGLSDYGFWCAEMKKEHAGRNDTNPPFRRGRIWC